MLLFDQYFLDQLAAQMVVSVIRLEYNNYSSTKS